MAQNTLGEDMAKVKSHATNDSDVGIGRVEDMRGEVLKGDAVDDNILLAQGHVPVMRRSFNLLGTLGLGFR
jgi:choline transport protein